MDILYSPHFYAHLLSSFALVVVLYFLIKNYKKLLKLDEIELIKMFSVLTIALAAHGDSHTTLDQKFNYNPIRYFTG